MANQVDGRLMKQINCIDKHVYLTGLDGADDINRLRELDIRYILNVSEETYGHQYAFEQHDDMKITVHRIKFPDNPNKDPYGRYTPEDWLVMFEPGRKFMCDAISANRNVLVHCAAGFNRSATMLLFYMLEKYRDLSLTGLYSFCFRNRTIGIGPAMPYFNFLCFIEERRSRDARKHNVFCQNGYTHTSGKMAVRVPRIDVPEQTGRNYSRKKKKSAKSKKTRKHASKKTSKYDNDKRRESNRAQALSARNPGNM